MIRRSMRYRYRKCLVVARKAGDIVNTAVFITGATSTGSGLVAKAVSVYPVPKSMLMSLWNAYPTWLDEPVIFTLITNNLTCSHIVEQ